MAILTTPKTPFCACKTLAQMVLTTLWTSWVGHVTISTPLRLKASCPTFLICHNLGNGALANEGGGAEDLC